ncbi:flagellar biosynthetic protein FliR [Hydrogenimonas thermophila]|uniref:flagellar biosynthetic protein FliR n=1 Tax=Hydrogenimonas thermophila TaxID=223786 RepID=UPI0029371471|nr:flagellar biosynthetic protein FliR [Hydrogenimonas thermophila]WOE69665.1 flagellar biosynthetic protein FliR [Hydrogenimonas thermophila]WOE72179.1 flagellar biosynthetic protein FliR [Hydrogenimonas thermophila]
MSWYSLLHPDHIYTFLLLFVRLSTLFIFLPFYNHMSVPTQIKAAFAFYLAIVLYPVVPVTPEPPTASAFFAAILSEVIMGLLAGLAMNIVFGIISYAGEQISFVMGFSMASVIDPQTQVQSPLVGQFLLLMATVVMLSFNGHYMMLMWMVDAIRTAPLGDIVMNHSMFDYLMNAMSGLFMFGFSIAFPIIALSLLSDVIFGMLMKTMPQFNLLVVGFPIKIFLSMSVWIAIFGSIMILFKTHFLNAIDVLMRWIS